ncbi:MAG: glycosyl hydrolase family 18 protein [Tissierellia bacterium]|nr:glycosyl hydrolase family 18 protein [Tissierellia bacterium]
MKKILLLIIFLILGGIGAFFYLNKSQSNNQFSKVYEDYRVIYEDEVLPADEVKRIDSQHYLSVQMIQDYFDETATYREETKELVFNNQAGEKIIPLDSQEASLNGLRIGLRDPIFEEEGKIFVPVEAFIHDFPTRARYNKDQNILVIDDLRMDYAQAQPSGDGVNLREGPSTSSPIVKTLNAEDGLFAYGKTEDGWYKVREKMGYQGYVYEENLDVQLVEGDYRVDRTQGEGLKSALAKPLNITWDYTYAKMPDEKIQNIQAIEGLDVIIPTWFSIQDSQGTIYDRGDSRYVAAYNNLGIDVWGYVDNQFDPDLTHEFLSNPQARTQAINKLLSLVKNYGLKGINIDFEQTRLEDRDLITDFVAEVYEAFKPEGILVSVDVTPPTSNSVENEFYDRKALSKVSDYVILMTYDQHWSSSDQAGSVAEYRWVESNINLAIRNIPKEKLILGVPFYTRIWSENDQETSSQSVSMTAVSDFIRERNLIIQWDPEAKQHYVETDNGGVTHKIWIEDAESIQWKASLMRKYNLAGLGSWRLGFETPGIWTIINDEFSAYQYLYQ